MVTEVSTEYLAKLKASSNLPSPPGVAEQIIELSSLPDSDIDTLAEIIRVDPALSAKILQYANSPLFRRATEIESLQQAASLFGWAGMLNLSLSLSLAGSINN